MMEIIMMIDYTTQRSNYIQEKIDLRGSDAIEQFHAVIFNFIIIALKLFLIPLAIAN